MHSRCKASSIEAWAGRSNVVIGSWCLVLSSLYLHQDPRTKHKEQRVMKLVSISLISWLFGLLVLSNFLVDGQGISTTVISITMAALLFSLAYAPSLSWLRQRMGGCKPALLFPLASAVVLNTPVFLIEILAIGRTLAPADALACIVAFLLMGTVFGLGFVWNYQNTAL
jgi:hypothetical protein